MDADAILLAALVLLVARALVVVPDPSLASARLVQPGLALVVLKLLHIGRVSPIVPETLDNLQAFLDGNADRIARVMDAGGQLIGSCWPAVGNRRLEVALRATHRDLARACDDCSRRPCDSDFRGASCGTQSAPTSRNGYADDVTVDEYNKLLRRWRYYLRCDGHVMCARKVARTMTVLLTM